MKGVAATLIFSLSLSLSLSLFSPSRLRTSFTETRSISVSNGTPRSARAFTYALASPNQYREEKKLHASGFVPLPPPLHDAQYPWLPLAVVAHLVWSVNPAQYAIVSATVVERWGGRGRVGREGERMRGQALLACLGQRIV